MRLPNRDPTSGQARTSRLGRLGVLATVVVLVGTTATAYAVHTATLHGGDRRQRDAPPGPSDPPSPAARDQAGPDLAAGGWIVFRHTGLDDRYGRVAAVRLRDPGGRRTFSPVTCDRVYATTRDVSCLRTIRGVQTRYVLDELDAGWRLTDSEDLPGVPSRTRLSPDGSLVATTTFVAAHSYLQTGFSTATEIRAVDGRSHGDLEDFRLVLDGREVAPEDLNIWGVTFLDDSEFYATAATGGHTWLVRGDLATRTLVGVRRNAECPSVSPDHTRVAYKVDRPGPGTWWSIAVLDLVTGRQTVLDGERADVDDQVEWLDGDTLLYGLPRTHQPGVTDVWAIDTHATAEPHRLIERAWSPSVVRP